MPINDDGLHHPTNHHGYRLRRQMNHGCCRHRYNCHRWNGCHRYNCCHRCCVSHHCIHHCCVRCWNCRHYRNGCHRLKPVNVIRHYHCYVKSHRWNHVNPCFLRYEL